VRGELEGQLEEQEWKWGRKQKKEEQRGKERKAL